MAQNWAKSFVGVFSLNLPLIGNLTFYWRIWPPNSDISSTTTVFERFITLLLFYCYSEAV